MPTVTLFSDFICPYCYLGEAAEDLLVSGVPSFCLHGVPVVGICPPAELRTLFSRILARRAAKAGHGLA